MRILGVAVVYLVLAVKPVKDPNLGSRTGCYKNPAQLLGMLTFMYPDLKKSTPSGIHHTGAGHYVATWDTWVPSGELQYQLRYHLESCGQKQSQIVVDGFFPVPLFHTRLDPKRK